MLSRTTRSARYRAWSRRRDLRGHLAAILAALAIAASGAVIACGDDGVAPVPPGEISAARNHKALGPLNARNAGAYHNAFLDFAFPRMLDAVARGADERKICKVIAQAMRDFVVSRKIAVNPASIGDDVAGGKCATSRDSKPGARLSLAGDGTPIPELDAVIAEMSYAIEAGSSLGELTTLFDQKVAYARANFPEAEAEVVAAAASTGLSSVEYWDANYAPQAQSLLDAQPKTYNRGGADAPTISMNRSPLTRALLAPPGGRLDGSFWSAARKVGLADLGGAVKGGIKGWSGGLHGIAVGAAVEGGATSAGALIAIALQ
ncbi:MAG: hypothetical protein ABIV11_07580 [Gemmatimonadaceae bacterium]